MVWLQENRQVPDIIEIYSYIDKIMLKFYNE